MTKQLVTLSLSVALSLLTGCGGGETDTDDQPKVIRPNKITVNVGGRPTQTVELDSFETEWEDIEIDSTGERNATEVARWVRQRHDGAMRCLKADPPDYAQAGKLFQRILEKAPSSSKDRKMLAQLFFSDAAYWWRTADVIAWEIDRIGIEKTAAPEETRVLSDDELRELIAEYEPYRDKANKNARKAAGESIKHFEMYRQMRPDDKGVFDFVWKLHFFLQNYEQALRWLDYVLREMDLAGIPAEEPLRIDYQAIRRDIISYLAQRKLDPDSKPSGRGLFPFGSGGRERLREDFTPGR